MEIILTIDLHAHFAPQELVEELTKRNIPPFVKKNSSGDRIFQMPHGILQFGDDFVNMDLRLEFMKKMGVDHQLLSFPGLFGVDSLNVTESLPLVQIFNDNVSKLQKKFPDKYSGLASLPMADIDLAVKEYRRARLELGLLGAILPNNYFLSEEHAQSISPIFKIAQEIGGHIFIHPGRRPDEVPKEYLPQKTLFADFMAERLALTVQHNVGHCAVTLLFSDFLTNYPDVSIHVANLGGTLPMVIERMDNVSFTRTPDAALPSTKVRSLYVDCSSLGPRSIELGAAIFGADKIVFGTDCPIFSTERSLDAVKHSNLTDNNKNLILSINATELLRKVR